MSQVMVDVRTPGGGSVVAGMRASDFTRLEKKERGLFASVESDAPMDLLILIEAHNRGDMLNAAAPLLVSELGQEDRVAVFTFGTGVEQKLEWTSDSSRIVEAVKEGGKGIQVQTVRPLSAIVEALKTFPDPAPAGRKRVILLLGDEQDTSSPMRLESVLANLLEKRVGLSVVFDPPRGAVMGKILPKINVTPGNVGEPRLNEAPPPRFGAQSLARLANESGGDAVAPNGMWFLEEMVKRTKERYLLNYCAEKRQARKMPLVELSDYGKAKAGNAVLKAPGLKREL